MPTKKSMKSLAKRVVLGAAVMVAAALVVSGCESPVAMPAQSETKSSPDRTPTAATPPPQAETPAAGGEQPPGSTATGVPGDQPSGGPPPLPVVSSTGNRPPGTRPSGPSPAPAAGGGLSFGDDTIGDQIYVVEVPIDDFELPEATGGSGTVSYGLSSMVHFAFSGAGDEYVITSGLTYNRQSRTLSGTPQSGTERNYPYPLTYVAVDEAGARAELKFRMFIVES